MIPLLIGGLFSFPSSVFSVDVNLGAAATFGVLSSTYTNTVAGTTINGDVGYTTSPAMSPTINGTDYGSGEPTPTARTDASSALTTLNGEACTDLGVNVALDNVAGHPTGVYTPGCYSSSGTMDITLSTTITLDGAGTYIFRSGGAFTTGANAIVALTNGAYAGDVFWTPVGAATLGASTTFAGNMIQTGSAITLGAGSTWAGRVLAFDGTVTTDTNTITVPAPTVTSATTNDADGNGQIDELTVVYSAAVNDANYDAVAVTGYAGLGTGSGSGTTTLVYNITESGSYDTGATPALTWTAANATDLAGGLLSTAGAPANAADGARPIMINAAYRDAVPGGKLDTVIVGFSESGVTMTMNGADWAFGVAGDVNLSGDFAAGECTGSGGTTMTCTDADTGSFDADTGKTGKQTAGGTHPRLDFTTSANFKDASNNNMASQNITLDDQVPALITTRVTKDTDSADGSAGTVNGQLDGILATFTEAMDASTIATTDFVLTTNADGALTEAYSDVTDDTTLFFRVSDAAANNTGELLKLQITGGDGIQDISGYSMLSEGASVAATDGAAPVLLSLTSTTADNTYGPTSLINITATYTETITGGSIQVDLSSGANDVVLSTITPNTTITGTYTVGATGSGENTSDLTVSNIDSNSATDGTNPASSTALPATNIADGSAIVIDTTASTVAITAPAAAAKVNGAKTFTFTSSEPGTQECNIDGGAWESCASADAFSTLSAFAALGEVAFTLNVRDTDAVGNVGTANRSFTKDTVAPTPNVMVGTAPIYEGDFVQEVTVTYDEAMDPGTTPSISFVTTTSFSSNADGAWSGGNTIWTETFTHDGTGENILPPTPETVNVDALSAATDLAGNSDNQDASPATFGIDTIDPVPTITSAPTPTNGTQTISFTATDTGGTGVASTACSVDGATFAACTTGAAYSTLGGWAGLGQGAFTLTLRVTDNAGNTADDTAAATKDTVVTITDGNISIAGDSGSGGAYKIGDTVTVTWDAATDGNTDIASASADLSDFGGGGAVGMTDTTACGGTNADNVYEACYTIVAGVIDATNLNATVSAVDNLGNSAGPVADSTNATVDNVAPIIGAAGTIALTDTSAEGIASIGENLTYAAGTVGAGDGDGWTVNLSAYGLSATQAPGAVAVVADNDDGAFAATETLTDNAGNTVTGSVTLTNFANIDNVAPVVSDANITVSGGTGTAGTYIIGDTVVVAWNSVANGNTDIASADADLSGWGGGAATAMRDDGAGCDGVAADGIWCAEYTITGAEGIDAGGINATVTGTDNADNSTGPVGDTTGGTVDTIAPIFATSGLSISTDNGVPGVAAINGGLVAADGITVSPTLVDADSDTITWDASAFGASATTPAGNEVTVTAGAIDNAAVGYPVTATDGAGNTTTSDTNSIDGDTISVDNIAPVTDESGHVVITLDNNTNGTANIGDTVSYTDGASNVDDGDTWTVDITTLTGDAAATNAGSPYTVILGTLTGSQQFTETVTDNAGNTDTGTTVALTVDNRSLLSSTDVALSSTVQNATSSYTISFTTRTLWQVDGKIKVTFPAGFDVSTLSGQVADNLSGMDGALTVTDVTGQVVTLDRDGFGTPTAPGAISFRIGTGTNPATVGTTGTFTILTTTFGGAGVDIDDAVPGVTITSSAPPTTECSDGIDNDGNGLIDFPADSYCTSAADTLEAYEGGGGGGGGGGASTSTTSNSTTTTAVAPITTLEGDQTYSSPVQFDQADITVDEDNGTSTAQLTDEGSLTMKPNSKSTISAYFPPNTEVTGPANWNGRIDPPVVRSLTMITRSGEKIEGSDEKLMRDDVAAIIKVGATVPLQFSQEVTLEIPVDLPNGSVVLLYTSQDGNTWEVSGEGVVQDGKLVVKTDHFSYFAVATTGETMIPGLPTTGTTRELAMQVSGTSEAGFADIIGHWAEAYINEIANLGIVSGKTATTYAPNDYITRAELTKIATKAFGVEIDPTPGFSPFVDVTLNDWFAPYVIAARSEGIVQGIGNELFAPNEPITRAAALKIILESAGFGETSATSDFDDVPTDAWFNGYVSFASQNGVVSGYGNGNFGPGNSITRAEVAKIVIKVMDLPKPVATAGEDEETPAE